MMCVDYTRRGEICSARYAQRQADGAAGWNDAYDQKLATVNDLLARYQLAPGSRFLDLGCGNGVVTLHQGHEAYGIEIAEEGVAWARELAAERRLDAQFTTGNVVTLEPYADGFFDLIFDGACLSFIIGSDRPTCFANLYRVLKPGGVLYAGEMMMTEEITERVYYNDHDYFDPQLHYHTVNGQPMYHYSRPDEFLDLLERTGFRLLRQEMRPKEPQHDLPFAREILMVEVTRA